MCIEVNYKLFSDMEKKRSTSCCGWYLLLCKQAQYQDYIIRNKAIYLAAVGGAGGALLSKWIKSSEVITYEDLGK